MLKQTTHIMILAFLALSLGKEVYGAEKGQGKSRERIINREGRSKHGDQSKVDFEEADISGQRKVPLGQMISNTKADKNYDLVKIRYSWHPEMVQSASSLESGRTIK